MVQLYRRKGGDALVNTQTQSHQSAADIAVLPGGFYVVVWADSSLVGGDSSQHGIKAQRFDEEGNKVGGEFLVNSTTAGNQIGPFVAGLESGRFVAVWTDPSATGGDTASNAVRAQLFEANGTPVGGEFLVNTQTAGSQTASSITGLAGGGFAIAWNDFSGLGGDSSFGSVKAQIFDGAGARIGGEILVNTTTAGNQNAGGLIALPSGGFAAVWISIVPGGPSQGSTMLQLFDPAGSKLGSEIVVNGTAGMNFNRPNIAVLPDGFLVTWAQQDEWSGDPVTYDIRAQKLDLSGAKVGAEFVVNAQGAGNQSRADVFALPGGGYIVTWEGSDEDGSYNVFGQIFDSAGARVGVEFVVSSGTQGDQLSPKIGVLPSGDIVVVWSVDGTEGDGSGFAVKSTILTVSSDPPTDIALSPAAVSETAIENVAVATLSATGGVNSLFTFELLDDAGGAFRLEGNRLVVADNSLLDFETDPEMNVTVRTTDSNGLTYTEVLSVAISDTALEKRFAMGPDFRVNVDQSEFEANGVPIPLSTGGFAILFGQYLAAEQGTATRVRFFDAQGVATSGDIALDDRSWFDFSVTPLANGGFLTARSAPNEPHWTFTQSLRVQAWDSAGNPVGPETMLDVASGYLPVNSSAILLSTGGYLVAWQSENAAVRGQLFGADGVPVGDVLSLGPVNTGHQFSIAATPAGGFLVSRLELAAGPEDSPELKTQFYDPAGAAAGPPVSVPITYSDYLSMALIALEGGSYILGWMEQVGAQAEVKAQAIGADGLAVGDPMLLATAAAEYSGSQIQFVAHPDGGFFVAWPVPDDVVTQISGRLFDSSGQPVGDPFDRMGNYGGVAVLADGTIVRTWNAEDDNMAGTYARLYRPSDQPIDPAVDDVLTGDGYSNLLDGQGGNDQLYGLGGDDDLIGGSGNDLLDGGIDADEMTGGTGDDIFFVDDAGDLVIENSGEGLDEVRTARSSYVLAANVENLTATSDVNHDFRGNGGNNVITGGAGNDNLRLQDGGDDTIFGGGGNDNLFLIGSLTAADVVTGGAGNDTLILQGNYAGGLALTANVTQIELISILAGSNTNFGESGAGRYDYVLTTHDSNFSGAIQVRVNGSALLAGEDFTFDGSAELDSRFVVYGGRGVDTLTGSRNNDIFFLAEERFATGDTVNGGAGYDGMFLRGNYTIDFNAPGYTGLFTNIENLTLTSATDERYARGGGTEFDYNLVLSDAIVKPGETLTVSGTLLMANETMIVDASAETDGFLSLFGGKASDTLKGGGQADLIHGNLGADILAGNGGADVFRYQGVGESTGSSMDHILDFAAGVDKVDLSRVDSDTATAGNQAFTWIGSNAFSGTAGQLRAYQDGSSWFVEGDTDGDGAADLVIQLTVTGGPLGQSDFLP